MFVGLQPNAIFVGQLRNTGRLVFITVTVWLQLLLLPHASVATHVRVTTIGHMPLVAVVKVSVTLAPLQASDTVGSSKVQAVPQFTVLLLAQLNDGGLVSTMVTV